jgi:protein-S-isoprenylcysteine O-methyltransferase Ste14
MRFRGFIFTYRGALIPLALLLPLLLPSEPHGRWHYLTGALFITVGIIFRVLGIRGIGNRARVHSGGTWHLVTTGIYGRVRNPLYLGNVLFIAGAVALYFSLWCVPLVLLYLFWLYTIICLHEEYCLARQIGEPYIRYQRSVPRWWLNVRIPGKSNMSGTLMPWDEVLKQEMAFIIGGAALTLLAPYWHGDLYPFLFPDASLPAALRILGALALIPVVSLGLGLKIGLRLQKKRGSWLAVDRISGDDDGY